MLPVLLCCPLFAEHSWLLCAVVARVAVVINEIKSKKELIAHGREDASVLFTDIVSFTTLASKLSPEVN
jgi:class 3 adenylate cyclase